VAVVVVLLVVGAFVGRGLATTQLHISDGLTWLGDDKRGTAVQVNPATGQPQTELKVGTPGNRLDIGQRDGLLVVNDTTTGAVTLIDVATLIATGRRTTTGDGATKILLDASLVYLVDRPQGTIRRIDPVTAADVGHAWSAGVSLADAAVAGNGTIWALGVDGRLHSLVWSAKADTLTESAPARAVTGSGPRSVLVSHDTGVTVFAPDSSVVVRVGTDRDVTLPAPQLGGTVQAASTSPEDLAPAVTGTTVVIARDRGLVSIDAAKLDCAHPGKPVVHHDHVYLPCLGTGRVVVLDADGHHQPPDIQLQDGDPTLVLDDGRLFISVPGSDTGIVIDSDGRTSTTRVHDDSVPPRTPGGRSTNPSPTPSKPPATTTPPKSDGGTPPKTGPTTGPSSKPPTQPAPAPPPPAPAPAPAPSTRRPGAPTNVSAQAVGPRTVRVDWTAQGPQPDQYLVLRADTMAQVASVAGNATSALVTTLTGGTTVSFVVAGVYGTTLLNSASSPSVTVFDFPGSPGGVNIVLTAESTASITVLVQWTAAADNGGPISGYQGFAGFQDGSATAINGPGLSASITLMCPCDGRSVVATVGAVNAAGPGATASSGFTYTAPTAAPSAGSMRCHFDDMTNEVTCTATYTSPGVTNFFWTASGKILSEGSTSIDFTCLGTAGAQANLTVTNMKGSLTIKGGTTCGGNPRN
jgi:hypothetical protein